MTMNPLDIFFGIVQFVVAGMLLFRMDLNILPNFAIISLAVLLVISAVLDLFSA